MEGLLPDLDIIRKDFPILVADGLAGRAAPGLPGLGQHQPEAAGRHRHDGRPPRAAQRQHRPRDAHAGRRVDRGLRGRPRQGGGVHRRPGARGRGVHQEHHRGPEPAGQHLRVGRRRPACRARRRGRHHRDGAPLQHRAVAAAHRAHRRDAALVRAHRRRPARPVEPRRARQRAHQGRLADLGLQHARHDQPGPADRGPRPRGGRGRRRRRRPGRAAAARRRDRLGRRLPRLHRPQDRRPDRHRRAVGEARAARTRSRPSTAAAR